jgi:hypothetical protein
MVGSRECDPLENWTWGLSLIAVTMAIHATGIAFMAFATVRMRVRMESVNRLSVRQWRSSMSPDAPRVLIESTE